MEVFLTLGGVGIALLLLMLVVGDHFEGFFNGIGGGEWFTGAGLAGFVGSFGFAAAIVIGLSGSMPVAIGTGVLVGLVVGALVTFATFKLRGLGDTGGPRIESLVGTTGTVISAIPSDGYGEVSIAAQGSLHKLNARSTVPVAQGTEVTVTDVLSPTSVRVRPTYR
jgi:membrane protein implicated in regulation of membrane protease activity